MTGDQCVAVGAGAVHPGQPARDPQAGLVDPDHLGVGEAVGDRVEETAQAPRGAPGHRRHGGFRDRGAEQLGQRLGGALAGQELADVEVDDDRGDLRPVLHRGRHPFRRRSAGAGAAAASAGDQLMLGHPHPDRGQVEHLPTLHTHPWSATQVSAAAFARARLMTHDLVRICDLRQRRSRMARLPTGLTPTAAAQRFRSRLGERRVRRRRLRRVLRVHPHTALQLGVLRPQRSNLGLQLRDRRRLLRYQGGKLVIRRTPSPGLHPKIIPQTRSNVINDLTSYLNSSACPQSPPHTTTSTRRWTNCGRPRNQA
jgi:hypothetical protein